MKEFRGKVIVITGAGSGMGRSYAIEFAKLGSKLALIDFDSKGLEETVDLVKRLTSAPVIHKVADVSDRDAIFAFADEVKKDMGNAHVIINNAGVGGESKPVWLTDEDSFNRTIRINFFGVVYGTRAFLPQLLENQEGAVVNISSIFGLVGTPGNSDYCASKFAVRGFTEALMVELQDSPVSVHLVHPGGIRTNIAAGDAGARDFEQKFLITPPDDVARRVIRGIRKGEQRIVYGNQSFRVWAVSQFVPLKTRNRMILDEMIKVMEPTSYAGIHRSRPKAWGRVRLAALAVIAALGLSTLHPDAGSVVYDTVAKIEVKSQGLRKEFVDIGDMKMATYQRGPSDAKTALLLVHGYTADKDVWVRFAKSFGSEVRIVIPDLAGHGETGFAHGWSYSPAAQAERLVRLLNKLGIDRVVIAGNSMGGAITAEFAARYPQRTNAVVLVDPAGVKSPRPSESDFLFERGESPFEVDNQDQFFKFYAMTMAKPPYIPGFVLKEIGRRYQVHKQEYARIAEDLRGNPMEGRLDEIRAPTLLIWGKEDRIIDVSAADVWKQGLPNAEVVELDGIGHMPMVEQPSDTAELVKDFLNKTHTALIVMH